METIGFLIVMSVVQEQEVKTINSFVLEYENNKNPKLENRRIIADMLDAAASYIQYNSVIEQRALEFEQCGIRHFDALHLACAEYANADFFVSCDDNLLKRADTIEDAGIKVISLLNFIATEVF